MWIGDWFRRRQAAKDEQAAAALDALEAWATGGSNTFVVQVHHVYQHGRRGTKAFVRELRFGRERDAWFWAVHSLRSGEILAITATSYWGPHSGRKDVLYIGAEGRHGIYGRLPGAVLDARRRHRRRLAEGA